MQRNGAPALFGRGRRRSPCEWEDACAGPGRYAQQREGGGDTREQSNVCRFLDGGFGSMRRITTSLPRPPAAASTEERLLLSPGGPRGGCAGKRAGWVATPAH